MTPRRARMMARRYRAWWGAWAAVCLFFTVSGMFSHPGWVAAAVPAAWAMVIALVRRERYIGWLIGHDVARANARDHAMTRR